MHMELKSSLSPIFYINDILPNLQPLEYFDSHFYQPKFSPILCEFKFSGELDVFF